MPVVIGTMKDQDSGLLSHPPALTVFCWGFPQSPTNGAAPPLETPAPSLFTERRQAATSSHVV